MYIGCGSYELLAFWDGNMLVRERKTICRHKYTKISLIRSRETLVGLGTGRKYTNTRLMTLSQSTCFVTREGEGTFSNG